MARRVVSTKPATPPAIVSLLAAPAQVAPGGTAQLSVVATSADGLPLSYAWSVAGTGFSIQGSGASAVLTAPALAGQGAIASVDVTDAAGAGARGSVAITTGP